MSLASLPAELIDFVLAKIYSKPTLNSLSQCSRRLYLCTVPYLYQHVTIQEEVKQGEQQTGRLRDVASLLLRRPELAEYVREFTLHLVQPVPSRMRTEEVGCPRILPVDQTFETAVNGLNLSEKEVHSWLNQLGDTRKCHYDLILALLLPALFKMEKLILDLKTERKTRKPARRETYEILTTSVSSEGCYHYPYERSTAFIASILKLSAVQEISASFGSTWDDSGKVEVTDKNLIDLDSASSSLTSLDLTSHSLSAENLGHILRAPKALKTFFYRVCPDADMTFTEIQHALKPQEKCLESLGFDYDDNFEELYGVNNHRPVELGCVILGSMISFSSFNNLKVFKTAALFLGTTWNMTDRHSLINIFPLSLATLHLTSFETGFVSLLDALVGLIAHKSPQQIPSLKTLILEQTESNLDRATRLTGLLLSNTTQNTQDAQMKRLYTVAAAKDVSVDLREMSNEDQLLVAELDTNDGSSGSSGGGIRAPFLRLRYNSI